jgi:hypothetical protein
MFNFRNFTKLTKNNEGDKKFTLDSKHKDIIKNFNNDRENIPLLKKKFIEIANEYKIYKSKLNCDMTNEDFDNKFKLKKELKELRNKINSIENNDDIIQYYLNVGIFLHDYYENINTPNDSQNDPNTLNEENVSVPNEFIEVFNEKPDKNQLKDKQYISVIDFYNNREKIKLPNKKQINKDESNNFTNIKMSNFIEKKDGFQRANCLDYYLKKIDKNYNPTVYINKDFDKCPDCKIEMTIYQSDGFQICHQCGRQDNIITESDKPSFKDPPPEVSYFAYKRMNHFNECIAQFQGKESTEIPQEVFNKLILEIKKERITNLAILRPKKIREYLKKLKLNKFYEHIPYILYRINGISPPILSKQLEEKLRLMFKDIQSPFRDVKPKNRKNFLSYSYVLYKFLELLDYDKYKSYFPLLKDREKLHETDLIWKDICYILNWEFIKSL